MPTGGQCAQPWADRAEPKFDTAPYVQVGTGFSGLRLWRSRRPGSISSRTARIMQPEANRAAPFSRICRSTALPAESTNVTASSSTRTDEASRRAVTLDQQRASSSTQGPASRPSSVMVAPPGRVLTEIRSIELSLGKNHTARAGRSRGVRLGAQASTRIAMPTSTAHKLAPGKSPMAPPQPWPALRCGRSVQGESPHRRVFRGHP